MKYAGLFTAGLLMELVWACGTLSLQHRAVLLSVLMAAIAPYLNAAFAAITVVDETHWRRRLIYVSWYAAGSVAGLLIALACLS